MGQQSSKESESSVVGSTVRAVSGATGAAAGAVKDTAGQVSQISCIYHCKNEWAYVCDIVLDLAPGECNPVFLLRPTSLRYVRVHVQLSSEKSLPIPKLLKAEPVAFLGSPRPVQVRVDSPWEIIWKLLNPKFLLAERMCILATCITRMSMTLSPWPLWSSRECNPDVLSWLTSHCYVRENAKLPIR